MKKVLLSNSYFYRLDPKQWRFRQPYPPLGTIWAGAVLQQSGFDVSLFDTNLRKGPEEISLPLTQQQPDYLVIYDDGFNYLTKMCLTVMREAAFMMIREGKKNNCPVIISSSDSTDHFEMYIDQGADYVIRGEGEATLKELLLSLESGGDKGIIPGIAYRNGDEIEVNTVRPVLRDLDSLPPPAWDLIDAESYRAIWKKKHGYFSLNIATTRGCPYKCNWCAKPIYGNRYNSRSPEQVVDEIEFLLKKFQPDHFWMCDDIFGLKPKWIKHFSDLVKERKLTFKYKIQSRVDLLLEENTIQALADSGAETVWVGAESGSQKILDAMDKGTTTDQIYEATRQLKSKGIRAAYFLQFGYLGETIADINSTLNMVLEMMPEEIGISISYPLPGTKFHDLVKNELIQKQNWTDSDDLAMMYQSTFPAAYYKVLHRYIHSRYRIKRGLNQLKKRKLYPLRTIASLFYHWPLSVHQKYKLNQLSNAVR